MSNDSIHIVNKVLISGIIANGVHFIHVDESTMTFYISVPSHAEKKREDEPELAGDFLAKRVKEMLQDATKQRVTVKYKIRDEYWTLEQFEKTFREQFMSL